MSKVSIFVMVSVLFSATQSLAGRNSKRAAGGRSGSARVTGLRTAQSRASLSASSKNADDSFYDLDEVVEATPEKVLTTNDKSSEELFNDCMARKTTEVVMQYEDVYDDYMDMITDIYGGVSSPAFKCIYSDELQNLYTKYYFGRTISSEPNGTNPEKITQNSIKYYSYLKENAMNASVKKIPITFVDSAVITAAGIKQLPYEIQKPVLPDVSYKITLLKPNEAFNNNVQVCLDEANAQNQTSWKTYKKSDIEKWRTKWKSEAPTVSSSCRDYEVFLTDKLSKAKADATQFITSLKQKLSSVIEEHNMAIDADKQLKMLK